MTTFAERLFDELSAVEDGPDFEAFCEGIGAMFQPVEDIAGDTEDGDIGYSILVDIDRVTPEAFGFIAQFVGVKLRTGLSDDDQREWIRTAAGFARGRPSSIIAAAKSTLTGTKTVILRERDGSAWRFTVVTRTSETPDSDQTRAALKEQKPAPDIMNYIVEEAIDYEWLRVNEADYSALETDFADYEALKERHI